MQIKVFTPKYFGQDTYLGGGERHVMNMARAAATAFGTSCEIEILSLGPKSSTVSLEGGLSLRVLLAGAATDEFDRLSPNLPSAVAGADLVHVHQPFVRGSMTAILAAKQQGIPVVVTDNGMPGDPRWGNKILAIADSALCYSRFGIRILSAPLPTFLAPGGVDTEFFTPGDATRSHFLYVGRVLPHKGIERLIRCLPADAKLIVCGEHYDSDYSSFLKEMAKRKDVFFLRGADDRRIRELYRTAIATVLASVYEDIYGRFHRAPELMGLVLLESMGCGTPVVCSNVGAMPEYVTHEETGFIFNDDEELRTYLTRLLEDSSLVERMGRAARVVVHAQWGLASAGEAIKSAYQSTMTLSSH